MVIALRSFFFQASSFFISLIKPGTSMLTNGASISLPPSGLCSVDSLCFVSMLLYLIRLRNYPQIIFCLVKERRPCAPLCDLFCRFLFHIVVLLYWHDVYILYNQNLWYVFL